MKTSRRVAGTYSSPGAAGFHGSQCVLHVNVIQLGESLWRCVALPTTRLPDGYKWDRGVKTTNGMKAYTATEKVK